MLIKDINVMFLLEEESSKASTDNGPPSTDINQEVSRSLSDLEKMMLE